VPSLPPYLFLLVYLFGSDEFGSVAFSGRDNCNRRRKKARISPPSQAMATRSALTPKAVRSTSPGSVNLVTKIKNNAIKISLEK
jgi:hypothetical protein